jgi:hypothetical protein
MKKVKRFVGGDFTLGTLGDTRQIIIDKETGVNYLMISTGFGVGLTVLVDKDGKPIITSNDESSK